MVTLELDPDEIFTLRSLIRFHVATWGLNPDADFTLTIKGGEATITGEDAEGKTLDFGIDYMRELIAASMIDRSVPDELITTADAARLLMVTTPELLRRHRDEQLGDEIGALPKPLRGYWDRQAVEALSAKWCEKVRSGAAVVAGAGGGY